MPVCADCRRWSPGICTSCPDCAGALEPDPYWARPGDRDTDLARESQLATKLLRLSTDPTKAAEARANAAAGFEEARRRYEARFRELEETVVVEAQAAGMTAEAHRAAEERKEAIARQRYEGSAWLGDPGGHARVWLVMTVFTVLATVAIAIILAVGFLLVGRSPLAAIGCAVVGGVVGMLISQLLYFGTYVILDRLSPVSSFLRRTGERILFGALLVVLVLPPGLAVAVSLLWS